VSGWAITRRCLSYPTDATFSTVIGCTVKPVAKDSFLLSHEESSKLQICSELDLTADLNTVIGKLKHVPSIEETTHVYYAGMCLPALNTLLNRELTWS